MQANDPNLPYLRQVAEALGDLRDEVVAAAPAELRQAVAAAFGPLLKNPDFSNVLPGLLAEPERVGVVMARLKGLNP